MWPGASRQLWAVETRPQVDNYFAARSEFRNFLLIPGFLAGEVPDRIGNRRWRLHGRAFGPLAFCCQSARNTQTGHVPCLVLVPLGNVSVLDILAVPGICMG